MLEPIQIAMLATAFARKKDLVTLIFTEASKHNDIDTMQYIAEHYASKLGASAQRMISKKMSKVS